MPKTWSVTFAADEMTARQNICRLRDALADDGIDQRALGTIELVMAEAVNNIVEHAYAGSQPGEIEMSYKLDAAQVDLHLRDFGNPIPGGTLPEGRPHNLNVPQQDLPEGGFGWFLIRQLTSRIDYSRDGQSNKLDLCFELPDAQSATGS
jgi:serine/threonine-protein kinase RsbW